jgi:hypothetical protein
MDGSYKEKRERVSFKVRPARSMPIGKLAGLSAGRATGAAVSSLHIVSKTMQNKQTMPALAPATGSLLTFQNYLRISENPFEENWSPDIPKRSTLTTPPASFAGAGGPGYHPPPSVRRELHYL